MNQCPVERDLSRELAANDRDEMLILAIEHEADMLLADDEHGARLAESFVESVYDWSDEAQMRSFHRAVHYLFLKAARTDPAFCREHPDVAKAAVKFVDMVAENLVNKEAA